jgi:Spy/CpxP family protein refolding chaperone
MNRRTIFSLLAAVPLAATIAFAGHDGECSHHGKGGPDGGEHGHRHEMRLQKSLAELDLTADQQKKIDAIFAASKKDGGSDRGGYRDEYKKLHTMLEQDKPDEKAIFAQVDKIGEMKTEKHKAMLKTLLAVRAELTPEQRQKLKEMKKEHHGRHGHHGRHHGTDEPKGDAKDAPETE